MIQPLNNYLILEEIKKEKESGIIIPDSADTVPSNKGKIISVGSDVPPNISPDLIVIFKRYGFEEIEDSGKKYLIGTYDNVIAVLNNI